MWTYTDTKSMVMSEAYIFLSTVESLKETGK
jgi:hypothetical protein